MKGHSFQSNPYQTGWAPEDLHPSLQQKRARLILSCLLDDLRTFYLRLQLYPDHWRSDLLYTFRHLPVKQVKPGFNLWELLNSIKEPTRLNRITRMRSLIALEANLTPGKPSSLIIQPTLLVGISAIFFQADLKGFGDLRMVPLLNFIWLSLVGSGLCLNLDICKLILLPPQDLPQAISIAFSASRKEPNRTKVKPLFFPWSLSRFQRDIRI